ncbi:MAG: hypothetical protein RIG82_07355 [Phycisphaeraceae bacterium]
MNPYKPRPTQPTGQPAAPDAPPPVPLPAARADLLISPQLYHGQSVYVVKDPVGLTYFRIRPAEYFVLRQLDGHNTAEHIATLSEARFPDAGLSADEIRAFTHQLLSAGLLLPPDPEAAKRLRGIRDLRRSKMRKAKLKSFLFIKIPVFDPERFLTWLYRYVGFVMNRPMMILTIIWMLASAVIALAHLQHIGNLAFPILSWTNALIFTSVFLAIKVIHEIGHGLAAKHHDLEVHETGVMLMVFLPLFYVDTSDAWTLPDKRDRLWITAGGVFIEMIFAAAAVWIWIASEPGWINQLAFNIMLSASITSLLFNANPLLRYDGYYFLMDWVEVPNLQSKSLKFLGQSFDRYILRSQPKEPTPDEAKRMPVFFVTYAVAAGLYRIIVLLSIVLIAWTLLDAFGLQAIGALLGVFSLTTMILLPAWKGLRHVWNTQLQSPTRIAATAVVLTLAALGLFAIWSFPVTESVRHPGVILAEHRVPIYVQTEGELREVLVDTGQQVMAGEPIAILSNSRLTDTVADLRIQLQILEVERNIARRDGKTVDTASLQIQIDQLNDQLLYGEEQVNRLTLRAPFDGRLHIKGKLKDLVGLRIPRGQTIGSLVGDENRRLALIVPQDDAALVQPGLKARARLWSAPWHELHGTVVAVERAGVSQLPHPALATTTGGEVDTQQGDPYKSAPSRPSILAWIELDPGTDQAPWWTDGMTGRGRIETGQTRLGPEQWRRLRQALTLDWWI